MLEKVDCLSFELTTFPLEYTLAELFVICGHLHFHVTVYEAASWLRGRMSYLILLISSEISQYFFEDISIFVSICHCRRCAPFVLH